jgi:hypothetical protein
MEEPRKVTDGAKADPKKQNFLGRVDKDREERIGKAAEAFNAYHIAYAKDHNLEPDEVVAAGYLENLNCRSFYPPHLGGIPSYDRICEGVYSWFEANKSKR